MEETPAPPDQADNSDVNERRRRFRNALIDVDEKISDPTQVRADHQDPMGAVFMARVFIALGAALAVWGFYVMFTYNADHGKVVGGDAFNFMIIATRGVGFIAAGIIAALAGVASLLTGVHSLLARHRPSTWRTAGCLTSRCSRRAASR